MVFGQTIRNIPRVLDLSTAGPKKEIVLRRPAAFASMSAMSEETTTAELAEKITELEIRHAFQVRQMEELGDVLLDAVRRLEALEKENRRLREVVERFEPSFEESPDE